MGRSKGFHLARANPVRPGDGPNGSYVPRGVNKGPVLLRQTVHGAGIVHRRDLLSSIVGLGKRWYGRLRLQPLGDSGAASRSTG